MKASLKMKIGNKELEINGEGKQIDIIKALSFWSGLPNKCGACGTMNVALSYRSPKGNDYYGLKCLDCGAEYNFHQLKTGGFYLSSQETWKIWNPPPKPVNPNTKQAVAKTEDDCPFPGGDEVPSDDITF